MKGILVVFSLVVCSIVSVFAADAGSRRFYAQGPAAVKALALTFDDGPGPYTERILAVLKQYGITATFFMEGMQAEMRPALAQKVVAAGHEAGNHTYQHINWYAYAKDDKAAMLATELDRAAACIRKATGVEPRLARLPNGYSRTWAVQVAGQKNYTVVNWSFGCDWQKMTVEKTVEAYIHHLQPGAILLMHDGGGNRQRTLEALPRIIEAAQQQGYRIVPVSELLGLSKD
jgi:peptidoglycan/xylan/chitin deacetylase (PgdA/CDA1 family)